MSNIPSLASREIAKLLKKKGFILDLTRGSHQIWLHPISRKRAVVPTHTKELPKGTLFSILKQAGINKDEM